MRMRSPVWITAGGPCTAPLTPPGPPALTVTSSVQWEHLRWRPCAPACPCASCSWKNALPSIPCWGHASDTCLLAQTLTDTLADDKVPLGTGTSFLWKAHSECRSVKNNPFPNPVLRETLAQAGVWLGGATGAVLWGSAQWGSAQLGFSPVGFSPVGSSPGPSAAAVLRWLLRLRLRALAWELLPQTNHHFCYPYRRGHGPSIILPS